MSLPTCELIIQERAEVMGSTWNSIIPPEHVLLRCTTEGCYVMQSRTTPDLTIEGADRLWPYLVRVIPFNHPFEITRKSASAKKGDRGSLLMSEHNAQEVSEWAIDWNRRYRRRHFPYRADLSEPKLSSTTLAAEVILTCNEKSEARRRMRSTSP